jgi:hypothetical protein
MILLMMRETPVVIQGETLTITEVIVAEIATALEEDAGEEVAEEEEVHAVVVAEEDEPRC